MKFTDGHHVLTLCMIIVILFLFFIAFAGGCAILQPRGGDTIADLPTTGPEAMFQTLKKANWLFTLSVIGVGAGFYAFLNGSSKGIQVMASCFVVLSLIIGVTKYSAIIAAIAMIGAVCLMIYSTLVKGKALREVVQGVQDIRNEEAMDTMIGKIGNKAIAKDIVNEYLDDAQSKTTKAIIKTVKGKL